MRSMSAAMVVRALSTWDTRIGMCPATADPQIQVPHQLYVGGDWCAATGGLEFAVEDPATTTEVALVADASPLDGVCAIDAADEAFHDWSARAPRARAEVLRRAFELIAERREELARLIVRENGKVLRDALAEVDYSAEFFRWFSEEATRLDGEIRSAPSGANRILVVRQPVGVSVLVTPWNFPAAMAARKIAPALAAGCTVILKPAPETPLTALVLADLLREAGVPGGAVNVLPSSRAGEVVAAMLRDPRVRKLSFTGSTEVGRALLALAGERVLNVSMELGGNAPFVVFADADLDAATRGAVLAKMRNGGQACTAANRFYVEAPVYAEFAHRLADAFRAMRVGSGLDPESEVGPLISDRALDRVVGAVDDAVGRGATPLVGGAPIARPGWFFEPTVLADVHETSSMLSMEIFGPVAPVMPFTTYDEVVALANRTEHGLVAYVYTGDLGRALAFAEAVEAGMVGVNRGLVSDPAAPFGGVKQSGLGREGGHEGVLAFTESKYVALEWNAGK